MSLPRRPKMPSTRIRLAALTLLAPLVAAFAVLAAGGATASPGTTTRVSVDSAGNQANAGSEAPSISGDGRYVAFQSSASNLVPGDTNGQADIFLHDRKTGETTRVSVDSAGNEGNSWARVPRISADGRYVAFHSSSSNLVSGDTNNSWDVFVHDRKTGETTRVSVDSSGNQANDDSYRNFGISADGRYVAFSSRASNLVANDTNFCVLYPASPGPCPDVFVHDRKTGETTRVSIDSTGNQANEQSFRVTISADGRYVAFHSQASNLVAGDTNGHADAFVHDRQTGDTTRVSVDSAGNQGNDGSGVSSISSDGRYIGFGSNASNLVLGDTNDWGDAFVHDRKTGETKRVSVNSAGAEGNSVSGGSAITADGRYVAFSSGASNLSPTDANGPASDVFIHELQSGETTLISIDSAGVQGNGSSGGGSSGGLAISDDGRYIAFTSYASNLVPGDTDVCGTPPSTRNCPDIFVHERPGQSEAQPTPSVVAPTPTISTPAPATTVPSSPTPLAAVIEAPPLGSGGRSRNSLESNGMALIAVAAGGALLLAAGGWYARRRRLRAG